LRDPTRREAALEYTRGEFMSVIDQLREFVKDVRLESAKVSWPTRDELRDSTTVVIVTVLMVAVFIGVVDVVLSSARKLLFH
jgi:preprotein translocase subunit SecE